MREKFCRPISAFVTFKSMDDCHDALHLLMDKNLNEEDVIYLGSKLQCKHAEDPSEIIY